MAEKPAGRFIRLINAWGDEWRCERVSVSLHFVLAETIFRLGLVVSYIMRCYLVFLLEEQVCLYSFHCNSML